MNSHVQRWGNSLAVRIPKVFADETGLSPNDEVEITVQDGRIVLTPLKAKMYLLDELLAGITPENHHDEWDIAKTL